MFAGRVFPLHDSHCVYRNFYFFYNEFFFHGDIPCWLPLGTYGIQSDRLFLEISPATHVAGIVGQLLAVKDTLLLFKCALFFEQLLMLLGLYLLSGFFFRSRTAIAFTCIAAMFAVAHIQQLYFNFRIFYLLPLTLWFVVRFFSRYRMSDILVAALIFSTSLCGMGTYIIVLPALILTIFVGVMAICRLRWRHLKQTFNMTRGEGIRSVICLILLISVLGVLGLYIGGAMEEVEIMTPGRDPVTLQTDLETFQTWGGRTGLKKFVGLVYPYYLAVETPSSLGLTFFVGLIPVGFALYGLFRERRCAYWAIVTVMLTLALFSLGKSTVLAEALYHGFPLMKLYRNIGLSVACFQVLVPLLAGFGVDHFLKDLKAGPERSGILLKSVIIVVLVMFAVTCAWLMQLAITIRPDMPVKEIACMATMTGGIILVGLLASLRFPSRRTLTAVMLVCLAWQGVNYQWAIIRGHLPVMFKKIYTRYLHEMNVDMGKVNASQYWTMRERAPRRDLWRHAFKLIYWAGARYAQDYNFLQFDTCVPFGSYDEPLRSLKVDILNVHVARFLRAAEGFEVWNERAVLINLTNAPPAVLGAMGCDVPKIRLRSTVTVVRSLTEADDLVRGGWPIDRIPIIETELDPPGDVDQNVMSEDAADSGSIVMNRYRPDDITLTASVRAVDGAWLYFADAWHPRWKGFVNGKPTDVFKANIAFKAIWLPHGEHQVRFHFANPLATFAHYFVVGVSVVMIGASFVLLWAVGFARSAFLSGSSSVEGMRPAGQSI
jgi:hypothetical protein